MGGEAKVTPDRWMRSLTRRWPLVVTWPPHFRRQGLRGILGEQSVPLTYLEYLELFARRVSGMHRENGARRTDCQNLRNLGRGLYWSWSAAVDRALLATEERERTAIGVVDDPGRLYGEYP